ncbi:uncharacterized protein LOC133814704 [Humulus lupulus]|uniref:uncharacterized protein LOC133814704 n=1 Tax=Humulus lupulus TaxID=3486 RepID=UPI002B40A929|nr:uncharacterized protein LOC133814704 [Humulus lupulus]
MANQSWLNHFTTAEVSFLNAGLFDPSPALLTVYPDFTSGKKPFKYFRMWNFYPNFHDQILIDWSRPISGTKMYIVVQKLRRLKGLLKDINKCGFNDIHTSDLNASRVLSDCQEQLMRDPLNADVIKLEGDAREKYAAVHKSYCSFLHQKAKIHWIKEGDDNTAFFHASIRDRRSQNRIYSITTDSGEWIDQPEMVAYVFVSYYKNLLGSCLTDRKRVITSLVTEGPILSREQSELLLMPFTRENVKLALFDIPGSKAPGPDGLRSILSEIIAQNQGGFVKGRSIAHKIMICQDLVRHYGRKSGKAKCLIKLDLRKAYDTLECDFIEEMLEAFNFPAKFISLVMQIMQMIGRKDDFKFHERCERLQLNHLIFADDVLLFCQGEYKSIYYMLQGLKLFSESSGLIPNDSKSSIYCCGMNDYEIQQVLDASGFCRSSLPFKYLGMPICSKRISVKECEVLIDKMLLGLGVGVQEIFRLLGV